MSKPFDSEREAEENKILARAQAIDYWRKIRGAKLFNKQTIKMVGVTGYGNETIDIEMTLMRKENWIVQATDSIFAPLLEQGMEKLKEYVDHVAKTGDLP